MKLKELLDYEKITIQCHDNPDADAIASGYLAYDQKENVFYVKGTDGV